MRAEIVVLLCVALLCSCAHKSGHNKRNTSVTSSSVSARNDNAIPRNLKVEVSNSRGNKLDGTTIFSKYSSAVFMVFTSDGGNIYQGFGFFINESGLAVSNYHVFQGTSIGAEQIKLVGDDTVYKLVEIIIRDEENDFILFRVNCMNTNYIPVAQSKPQVGEKVYAIGSPRGLENTFSSGEVSQWRDKNLMQINALIDHGSSGGALINEYGQVVGITSGTFADGSQANLNYAWSIDVIKPYINKE